MKYELEQHEINALAEKIDYSFECNKDGYDFDKELETQGFLILIKGHVNNESYTDDEGDFHKSVKVNIHELNVECMDGELLHFNIENCDVSKLEDELEQVLKEM